MMTSQELRTSPLFENISYEDYRRCSGPFCQRR